MAHNARPVLAVLAIVGAVALSLGCSTSTCNRDADGTEVQSDAGLQGRGSWASAPYHDPAIKLMGEPYQYFPPARTITFWHNLGSLPHYEISLAFSDNGSLAPTAGNQALIECMDDHVFQVKNDTCSDFYIWVTLSASGLPETTKCQVDADAGVAGAPADTSAGPADAGAGGAAP